jgi:hypothetical protein
MRIAKSLMLGVAGSVLVAGSAMAADPMPIVVAAMPAATAPATGREVLIDITAGFDFRAPGLYVNSQIDGVIDVTSASGWGVRLEGASYTNLVPPVYGNAGAILTLYRAIGDLKLGVWAGGGFNFPPIDAGFGLGVSANYEHESARLYISSENNLQLWPIVSLGSYTEAEFKLRENITLSAYFDFYNNFDGGVGIDVDLTDRLKVLSNLYYNDDGLDYIDFGAEFKLTDRFSAWSGLGFDLNPNPNTFVAFDWLAFGTIFDVNDELTIKSQLTFAPLPFAFNAVATWAELDHPIGTGPLSLIAELGVGFGNNLYAWGNIGIRYKLGGPEDHDDNRLFGEDSPF